MDIKEIISESFHQGWYSFQEDASTGDYQWALSSCLQELEEKEEKITSDNNARVEISQALARGYCHKNNSHKVVDPILIEAMVDELMKLSAVLRKPL